MQIRTVKTSISIIAFCCFTAVQAQENKEYKQLAADMEQNTWGSKDPIFESNVLPANYKNESAVILAKKYALETETKRKGDYSRTEGFRKVTTGVLLETVREKIYINDKLSLQDFSEMSFNKLQSKQIGFWGQTKKASYTFLGIRIIKPDGSIQKVNLDEAAVTLKASADEKKNKIAIPNLAIGDIIDYYIVSYDKANFTNTAQAMAFPLQHEYAIVNYSISLSLDKNIAVEYQSINGAPNFKTSKQDDDNVLELTASNLPKTKNLIWSSENRQLPTVRILYTFGDSYHSKKNKVKKGEVVKVGNIGPDIEKNYIEQITRPITAESNFKKDWGKYKKKHKENMSDSIVASYIYYYGQYESLFGRTPWRFYAGPITGYVHSTILSTLISQIVMRFYTAEKMKTDLLVAPGRNNVKSQDVFFPGDLNPILKVYTPKPIYWQISGDYAFGEVDPILEGEEATAVTLKGMRATDESRTKIERTSAVQNSLSETVSINFDKANPQLTMMKRHVVANGHTRRSFQKDLASKYDKEFFLLQALEMDEPASEKKPDMKEKFTTELTERFQAKPTELAAYSVSNFGFHHGSPSFVMDETFTMDAFSKKAGNNFIVEVGKLVGPQLEIKPEQRERTIDVYMPYARSYRDTIEITLPEGYEFEGIEKLNKKVENETGGFISSAKLENGKLTITTHKYYSSHFEKAANWSKLVAFIDAAFEFSKEKLLLKRK